MEIPNARLFFQDTDMKPPGCLAHYCVEGKWHVALRYSGDNGPPAKYSWYEISHVSPCDGTCQSKPPEMDLDIWALLQFNRLLNYWVQPIDGVVPNDEWTLSKTTNGRSFIAMAAKLLKEDRTKKKS